MISIKYCLEIILFWAVARILDKVTMQTGLMTDGGTFLSGCSLVFAFINRQRLLFVRDLYKNSSDIHIFERHSVERF
jgi:hypothetical protein